MVPSPETNEFGRSRRARHIRPDVRADIEGLVSLANPLRVEVVPTKRVRPVISAESDVVGVAHPAQLARGARGELHAPIDVRGEGQPVREACLSRDDFAVNNLGVAGLSVVPTQWGCGRLRTQARPMDDRRLAVFEYGGDEGIERRWRRAGATRRRLLSDVVGLPIVRRSIEQGVRLDCGIWSFLGRIVAKVAVLRQRVGDGSILGVLNRSSTGWVTAAGCDEYRE